MIDTIATILLVIGLAGFFIATIFIAIWLIIIEWNDDRLCGLAFGAFMLSVSLAGAGAVLHAFSS